MRNNELKFYSKTVQKIYKIKIFSLYTATLPDVEKVQVPTGACLVTKFCETEA